MVGLGMVGLGMVGLGMVGLGRVGMSRNFLDVPGISWNGWFRTPFSPAIMYVVRTMI
jgi:hypothetical protein